MSVQLLLDMDEILADFLGGVCNLWGCSRESLESAWVPGEWGVEAPLSKVLGRDPPMTQEQFLDHIYGIETFWHLLEPTPWMQEMIDLTRHTTDDWFIVSAPSCAYSHVGKIKWMKRCLPAIEPDRLIVTKHKYLFASDTSILIDDRAETVKKFEAYRNRGGRGILFPALHNTLHEYRHDPMAVVNLHLERTLQCI